MSIVLGCIGDDYTGSSDLANALTRAGLRTVQTIGLPAAGLDLSAVDAVVIALKSRSIDPADAVAMTLPARDWLRAHGARHIMFKICSTFDSTDRGNIGPVMDALRGGGDAPLVLVNSAFPETGRTIYRGQLFVGDVPLNESPLKDHPLNPMHDANLVRVLARQSTTRIGLIGLDSVEAGAEAIRARMTELAAEGCGAAIADCVFDRQLAAIGRAALETPLSVGASGLGIGLASALIERGDVERSAAAQPPAATGGPIAMLSGSCSAATLEQVAQAESWAQVLRIDPRRLLTEPAEVQRVLEWALEHMGRGPILIASSASPQAVQALQAEFGAEAAGSAIEQAMGQIAAALVPAGLRRLIVAGGETSGAVVNSLGLTAFAIGAEIAPGVPVLRNVGGGPGMVLALKSGNFGGRDFFADAAAMMP